MKVLAIVNQKGGVGKTATAMQLAAGLTARGERVLSVDLDPQANLSRSLHGAKDAPLSVYDVLVGGQTVAEAVVRTPYGDSLLSAQGHKKLSMIDAVVGNDPDKPYLLDMALEEADGDYDWAVIDTPGVRDTLAYNALVAADALLVPAMADDYSLEGIAQLADSVAKTRRRANKDLRILGVVLTIYRANLIVSQDMAENIAEAARSIGTSLFEARIRQSCTVPESLALGKSVFDYAPPAPVTQDYDRLVTEVVERMEGNDR